MRKYKVSDVRKFVKILAKVAESSNGEIANILTSAGAAGEGGGAEAAGAEAAGAKLIEFVLGKCYADCEEPLFEWLASLNGMTLKEFDELPPETVPDLIREIAENPESKAFFSKACRLFRPTGGSATVTSAE